MRVRTLMAGVMATLLLIACGGGDAADTADTSSGAAGSEAAGGEQDQDGAPAERPEPDESAPAYARILELADTEIDTSEYAKEGPYNIAAVTQGPVNAWGSMFDAQLEAAAEDNPDVASVRIYPSTADPETQIQDMGQLANEPPDAVILTPMNIASLSAPAQRLMDQGVPVITCQGRLEGDGFVTDVTQPLYPNNFEAAVELAERLGGEGNIVVLYGIPGVDMADISLVAAQDALENYPGITVVGEAAANWSVADAKTAMAGWLSSNEQIDGVLALGMEMGLGALQAVLDAGRDLPIVTGTGAMNGFNKLAIEENVEFQSKAFQPSVSKVCLDVAVEILEGTNLPRYIDPEPRMEGTWVFNTENAEETYKPEFADQLPLGPTTLTDEQLVEAGFGN